MNLLDIIKDQVSGALVAQASGFLGESDSGISKALDGIFPALLGKMISTSQEGDGAQKIFDMATGMDTNILDNMGDLFSGGAGNVAKLMNSGSGVLNLLMGNSSSNVIDKIAEFSGLKGSAASSLIKMAAPFLMTMVGKQIKEKALNAVGLGKLLSSQKEFVKTSMPNELMSALGSGFLGNAFGSAMGMAENLMTTGKSTVSNATDMAEKTMDAGLDAGKKVLSGASDVAEGAVKTGGSLLKWLVPAILALLVLGYLGKSGCSAVDDAAEKTKELTESAVSGAAKAAGEATDAVENAAGTAVKWTTEGFGALFAQIDETAKKSLEKMSFEAGTIGNQFMNFINDGFESNPFFTFSNLSFDTGSANITEDSRIEVDNLAAIMKAYTGVKIKITGYTDNTGDATSNEQLSKARAMAVKARLMAQGVDGSRIETEGKGSANPVASNETEEGRKKNRRIEVDIIE